MTTIDVIAMALEAGFKEHNGMIYVTTINDDCAKELKALVELVRADERNSWPAEMEAMERQVNILTDALAQEREACAKVCDETLAQHYMKQMIPARDEALFLAACADCAAAIRERSNK